MGQIFPTQKFVYFSQILFFPTFSNACLSTRIGLNGRNFTFGLFEQRVKSPQYLFFIFPPSKDVIFFYYCLSTSIGLNGRKTTFFECRKKGSNFRIADFFSPFASMFSTL